MGLLTLIAGRARVHPGPDRAGRAACEGDGDDAGMVTAEAAVAVLSLVAVTAVLLQLLVVGVEALRVGDAARAAVRAAARGESASVVAATVHRGLPAAAVSTRRDGDDVVVGVALVVRPPLLAGRAVTLRSVARAAVEGTGPAW